MNKRGISPLIATVLLIGFTIGMAAFVSTYIIKQTKQFDVQKIIGADELCSEVSFQVITDPEILNQCTLVEGSAGICPSGGGVKTISNALLKNKGSFKIWKFTINSENIPSYVIGDTVLGPASQLPIPNKLSFCQDGKINIVPSIKDGEGNLVECPSRTVTIIPEEMGFCNQVGVLE